MSGVELSVPGAQGCRVCGRVLSVPGALPDVSGLECVRDGVCQGWSVSGMECVRDEVCRGWSVPGMECAGGQPLALESLSLFSHLRETISLSLEGATHSLLRKTISLF